MGKRRAPALILMALLLLFSFSGLAKATTPAIDKAVRQAQALRELIDQLDEELSAATEEYDYANQQLDDTRAAIKATTKRLNKAEADLAIAQARLNRRVVEIYKAGDVNMLAVLLDASSFSELISRFQELRRLSRQDAQLVQQVKEYRADVTARKAELGVQIQEEQVAVEKAAVAKQKVLAQLEKQKEALKGKEAQIAQLKREEAARQAALAAAAKKAAEEARRKAAAEAAARAAAQRAAADRATRGAGGSAAADGSGGGSASSYDSEKSARVVDIAMQYLGVPYVWGGSSPSGFDCSGLVKYVYAKIGTYLPHSSAMQYSYGVFVSQDQLKPGDLVFFYNPIHHVGIYIGNGKMINATGDQVQISTVWKKSYYGARRILR